MKIFGRTGGYYLFWAGFIYLAVGLVNLQFKFAEMALLNVLWVVALLIPLTVPSVARYFNMSTFWQQLKSEKPNMSNDYKDNVYNLPTPKVVPPMPEVKEDDEESSRPAYQVGRTDDGRVTLRMGTDYQWTQVTMNDDGVDSLIRMLEAAKNG